VRLLGVSLSSLQEASKKRRTSISRCELAILMDKTTYILTADMDRAMSLGSTICAGATSSPHI
jgi:hypothetical protein